MRFFTASRGLANLPGVQARAPAYLWKEGRAVVDTCMHLPGVQSRAPAYSNLAARAMLSMSVPALLPPSRSANCRMYAFEGGRPPKLSASHI